MSQASISLFARIAQRISAGTVKVTWNVTGGRVAIGAGGYPAAPCSS
jgi:hypothetical protein